VNAVTPSVCVLSNPANDFFWEAAHIQGKTEMIIDKNPDGFFKQFVQLVD